MQYPFTTVDIDPQLKKKQSAAKHANNIISTTGMISLGLLAMLIIVNKMQKDNDPAPAIASMATISFFTAVIGKAAIVIYFSLPIVRKIIKALHENGIGHLFHIKEKSFPNHIAWIVKSVLAINESLFWAGLVQLSFIKSAELLLQLNTESSKKAGLIVGSSYFYTGFVLCSLYANLLAWPGVLSSAYKQKVAFMQWFLEHPKYRFLKSEVSTRTNRSHEALMKEIKQAIRSNGDEEAFTPTPRLDALMQQLSCLENTNTSIMAKLQTLIVHLREDSNRLQHLRQAYFATDNIAQTPLSTFQWGSRHFAAFVFTTAAILGFRNVLNLTDQVWDQWGASAVSQYGARYLAFYGTAEMVLQTVYPMIYSLTGIPQNGMPTHVISKAKLAAVLFMVGFVGIFGGLANSEQSALAGEGPLDIFLSDYASFALDAFAIYQIGKNIFESRLENSTKKDEKTVSYQLMLALKSLSVEACDTSLVKSSEWIKMASSKPIKGVNAPLADIPGEEQYLNRANQYKIFSCFERPLSKCFGLENPASTGIQPILTF